MRRLVGMSVALVAFVLGCAAHAAEVRELRLAAGKELGTYNLVGTAIHLVVEQSGAAERVKVTVVPTGGSTINIQGLRDGAFDLALVQADQAIAAVKGEGAFAGKPFPELRALARLHEETLALVVRSGVEVGGISDLNGKTISIGGTGAGGRDLVERLLSVADVRPATIVPDAVSAQKALCGKKADAVLTLTGHPSALLAGVIARCHATIAPIVGPGVDRLIADAEGLTRAAVPRRVYVGVGKAVPTVGTRALLAARADLDDRAAVDVVRAIAENLDLMRMLHPALQGLDKPADLKPDLARPVVHSAALRYLDELVHADGAGRGKGSAAK